MLGVLCRVGVVGVAVLVGFECGIGVGGMVGVVGVCVCVRLLWLLVMWLRLVPLVVLRDK